MLSIEQIQRLVDTMEVNDLTTLEVDGGDYRVRLVRDRAQASPRSAARRAVICPADGKFAGRGRDDGLAALARGAAVSAGEILGYLGIGFARVPVQAPNAGRLVAEPPPEGQDIGRGTILFELECHP